MSTSHALPTTAGLRPACRQDAGAPDGGHRKGRSAGFQPASVLTEDKPIWRSRGYLPHVEAPDLFQHVVFRLADSLPEQVCRVLDITPPTDRIAALDTALDQGHGKRDLANPLIAKLVQTALLSFDQQRYVLFAWCVMPNHVHALIQTRPGYPLGRIVHSWKSYTSNQANRLLDRTGSFWAREYFDRFMRDEAHLARTARYVEGNPVKAGLCENVSDWPFSSASREWAGSVRAASFRSACRQGAGRPDAQL